MKSSSCLHRPKEIFEMIFKLRRRPLITFDGALSGAECNVYPPPSPLALPLLGHLNLLKKPLHRSLAGLSAVHGPILSLRFGSRPVLHVASAADECLSKNDAAFGNRPRFLAGKHLGYDYTTLVWAPYGRHWRNLRCIAAVEFFSSSRLDSLSLMNQEAAATVKAVDEAAMGAAGVVELRPRLFDLSLNLIMKMVAGKRPTRRAEELREIIRESFEVSGVTNLADFIPALRLCDYNGLERRLIRLQGKRDDFLQELVNDQRREIGLPGNIIEGVGGELNGERSGFLQERLHACCASHDFSELLLLMGSPFLWKVMGGSHPP
ncbi:Isoflavone 2'-hydroxylase [Platanthera zijinensis]|uniref:Isoflavone 2'-hydroxylase n=1 Tax=Platanthera zijinensis TaxID=2320716 RepID=A0AAP0BFK6_9ASPA